MTNLKTEKEVTSRGNTAFVPEIDVFDLLSDFPSTKNEFMSGAINDFNDGEIVAEIKVIKRYRVNKKCTLEEIK